MHEIRKKVESGSKLYNSVIGPKGALLVDPMKEITWRGVVIGGVAEMMILKSKEKKKKKKKKTKLELNASHIKYESWTSFLRKLNQEILALTPWKVPYRYWNERKVALLR